MIQNKGTAPAKKEVKDVLIDDRVAEEITRVEELAYEIKIKEVMTHNLNSVSCFDKSAFQVRLWFRMVI